MKNRFDLEQEIMSCWNVVEDIQVIADYLGDSPYFKDMPPECSDKIQNLLGGVTALYDVKFRKLFETFEDSI